MKPFHQYQIDAVDFALANDGSNIFAQPGMSDELKALIG